MKKFLLAYFCILLFTNSFSQSDEYYFYGDQLLYFAYSGDFDGVKDIIRNNKTNVNFVDYWGVSALMFAAEQGHDSIVDFLIKNKADLNLSSFENGNTALHSAIKFNHIKIASNLIKAKADIDAIDFDGRTCVHYACIYGYYPILDLLLSNNAKPDLKDIYDFTPLIYAVMYNNNNAIMLLRLYDANANFVLEDSSNVFHLAAENSNIWYFENFSNEIDLKENIFGIKPIESSIIYGQYEMLNWFLENNYELRDTINSVYTPKTLAKYSGNRKTKKIIKNLGIKDFNYLWFDRLGLNQSLMFSKTDFFWTTSLSILEPRYGIEFETGFFYRHFEKLILQAIDNYSYYQLRESRKGLYVLGLKNFKLIRSKKNFYMDFYAGLRAVKWWGEFDGIENKIVDEIGVSPFLGISLHNRTDAKIKLSTEYLNTNIYAQSKFFYSLSLNFLINFRNNENITKHKYIIRY
ncbi:MAG: ankyrin repeat domain-containing protein [Bacteroidales bacterium]|nr:ankyrin repeat domain-containing protein [Bacteroidales bacterium]MCK9498182.1 ankyrin repeat domain-containing protein [Bacteroidales bacterium]MDY0313501.1 ankyrin repeat domain-containing protein [Bacteroidales bacterium]NLB87513.1 ankyrin repeat domain-containing protein [Bacteroidales bacterium]